MGSSPDEEDVERVERDYVNPESTSRRDVAEDLADEGFPGGSIDAFDDRIVSKEDVDVPERGGKITTREDVSSAVGDVDKVGSSSRREEITTDLARENAAPSESELRKARAQAASRVDDEGVVRTDPSVDPLAGSDGREVGKVSEIAPRTGGRTGGFSEGVERTGSDRGTYYYEDPSGNRYPIAEVQL